MNISHFTIAESTVQFLRWYYSDKNNIQVDSLRDNVWNAVAKDSGMKIESGTKISEEQVETTPALIVNRGTMAPTTLGLYQGLAKQSFGQDNFDNADHRVVLVSGSLSISCVGRTGAEAALLGHEPFFAFLD